jgi:predicted phosphohydrolase
MNDGSADVLCQNLLASLKALKNILCSDGGITTFDIEHNAKSADVFQELRRLERSLQQYAEKNAALLYVGFVGHFSAGKSSTINSLLRDPTQSDARITGLHPTDKAVTLITHRDNSASLIGAHKRGEVEVGSSLLDKDILTNSVVVDTPGSGDPLVLEEIVRDFLPICDRIIYTFSAAIPLDTTDLPVLRKIHDDLPFLPIRFIVTRADEFIRDRRLPVTPGNIDQSRMDTFIGELISRIAASVPGLNIAQEDVLLLDNVSGFNVERLAEFVFPSADRDTLSTSKLHSHKVDYYQRSARKIRQFFVHFAEEKCRALALLISTATSTRADFYDAVTMANSRLTESWKTQQISLTSKQKGNTDWVLKLAAPSELSNSVALSPLLVKRLTALKKMASQWSETVAKALIKAVSERLVADYDAYLMTLRESAFRSNKPDSFALAPFVADDSAFVKNEGYQTPNAIADQLADLGDTVQAMLHQEGMSITNGSDRLMEAIREKRVSRSLFESLQESIKQLEDMVATFFKSVQLYRSGVLSMNARELAERAGIGPAIDKLERMEVPDDKKQAWAIRTVDEIFSNRQAIASKTEHAFSALDDRLRELVSTARISLSALNSLSQLDARLIIREEFEAANIQSKNEARASLEVLLASFNEQISFRFQAMRKKREELLEARREQLAKRFQAIRRKRTKRLGLFALSGLGVGLLGYGGYYLLQRPFNDNWTAAIGVGLIANFVTIAFTWALGLLTDPSKDAEDAANEQHIADVKEVVLVLLRGESDIDCSAIANDRLREQLQIIIYGSWSNAIDRIVDRLATRPYADIFRELVANRSEYAFCCDEYVRITTDCATQLCECYSRTDGNLQVLANLSADIREEAIVPSFSMFEARNNELLTQLECVKSIQLG